MITDLFNWQEGGRDNLNIRVTPKASKNDIKTEHQADGSFLIRVYVTVVAEDGKANQAVLKLLAKELGVSKSSLEIISGHTSRDKKIKINRD